ncbi:nucleotide-diphospho-sugar transferase-domain-containing protein [Cryomyces antarcticus]
MSYLFPPSFARPIRTRFGLRRALLGLALAITTVAFYVYAYLATSPLPSSPRLSNITEDNKRQLVDHSIINTLVIVPVNDGMLSKAENLLCSLRRTSFDTSKILFWALDPDARNTLEEKGHVAYHDPSLFSVSRDTNLQGNTKAYKKMMLERPKFFIDILSTGLDVLMLDADTVFFQSPLLLRDPTVDAVFSTDAREFYQTHDAFKDRDRRGSRIPPVCNGIFWMKASPKTVRLWQDMLDVFGAGWRTALWRLRAFLDDQRGMDVLLNDGRARLVEPFPDGITRDMVQGRYGDGKCELAVRLLDQTAVVNGHLLKNRKSTYEKNLQSLRREGKDRIAAHLNWNTAEMTKEEGARQLGLWLLDEGGNCRV